MSEQEGMHGPGRRWPKGIGLVSATAPTPAEGESDDASPHDWVYHSLRRKILYSEIEPGSWLRQVDVAEQFGVSRTPVREAFRSLAQEGLVDTIPNYGVRVALLTVEAFEELYALRMGIEGLGARLAARAMTATTLATLHRTLHRLGEELHTIPLAAYLQAEWQFRVDCYRATERERLVAQVLYLREHAERYIRLAYDLTARLEESYAYHRALMAALEVQDGALAEQVVHSALRWTLLHAKPVVAQRVEAGTSGRVS
jgi:DNA-binding GntR family transcriptional regulator